VYIASGTFAIFTGPMMGRIADRFGKYRVFVMGSLAGMCVVLFYAHLGPSPMWLVIAVSVAMFAAITARMVTASALTSAVPAMKDRGAFMAINSSIQQVSGGIAAALGGMIVSVSATGELIRFDVLGFVVAGAMLVTLAPMWIINRDVARQLARAK
jgi:predicted MFS family arabinose efflux permease